MPLDAPAAFAPLDEAAPVVAAVDAAEDEARSFSFPRPVALLKTLRRGRTSLVGVLELAVGGVLEFPATRLEENGEEEKECG